LLLLATAATSWGLIDQQQAEQNPGLLALQHRSLQNAPVFDPNANRQSVQERRNHELLKSLSGPPSGWSHYDQPPGPRRGQQSGAGQGTVPTPVQERKGGFWVALLVGLLFSGAAMLVTSRIMQRRR
jgi:hypothetical protein